MRVKGGEKLQEKGEGVRGRDRVTGEERRAQRRRDSGKAGGRGMRHNHNGSNAVTYTHSATTIKSSLSR